MDCYIIKQEKTISLIGNKKKSMWSTEMIYPPGIRICLAAPRCLLFVCLYLDPEVRDLHPNYKTPREFTEDREFQLGIFGLAEGEEVGICSVRRVGEWERVHWDIKYGLCCLMQSILMCSTAPTSPQLGWVIRD